MSGYRVAEQAVPTGLVIQLMGRPQLEVDGASGYRFRSRKSWAVLALLLLGERAPTRSQLASLLFADADDPLRALRWCLAEIRRGIGPGALLDGAPVQLTLPAEAIIHEAALGYLSRGDVDRAHTMAVRAALMSPLDENHQALLIRSTGWPARRPSPPGP